MPRSWSTRTPICARWWSAEREDRQNQAFASWGVLVRRPVAGPWNPVPVEGSDGRADLADQEIRRPEGRVVALAPEQPEPTGEPGQVAQERPAAAHLAAVEARSTNTVGLEVYGLLGDAGRIAEHVDEQVVAADLAEELLVVPGLLVAPGRTLAEAAGGEAAGRDQTQVRHSGGEPPGEVRGDGPTEREPGESQRAVAREHLEEQTVHEVEVRGASHLARDGRRGAVRRVIERMYGEASGERLDVPGPVLPRPHAPVEEDDVRSAAAPVDRHPGGLVDAQAMVFGAQLLAPLEELDPDVVGSPDERDLDARANGARLHYETGAPPLELGHRVVHAVHAQPEMVQTRVGLRRSGRDRGIRRHRRDEDRQPVQIEIGPRLAVRLDRFHDLGVEHLVLVLACLLYVPAAQVHVVVAIGGWHR